MLKKIKYIFYLILFTTFVASVISFYFSDLNINKINKFRSINQTQLEEKFKNLPLLENDTKDIIEYKDDVEVYKKKKKKYKFWDLIKDI